MSVISAFASPFLGAAGQTLDFAAVIFAKLLGEVVVTVDQRSCLEDAIDPRLGFGIDRLGCGWRGDEHCGDQ